tara:strand:+ start:565 stop:1131 length:567 start_codon:yes stop_codon:yes gene_type:complete
MTDKVLLTLLSSLYIGNVRAAEGKGGMPQLNPESFSSQLFWLFIFFLILFLSLHYYFLPKINKIKSKRDKTIEDFIAETKKINDSVERIIKKINDELNEAKETYDNEIKLAYEKNKKVLDGKLKELDQEYEEKKEILSEELSKSKEKVLENISKISVPLSDQLFEKIIGEKIKGRIEDFKKIVGEKNV